MFLMNTSNFSDCFFAIRKVENISHVSFFHDFSHDLLKLFQGANNNQTNVFAIDFCNELIHCKERLVLRVMQIAQSQSEMFQESSKNKEVI